MSFNGTGPPGPVRMRGALVGLLGSALLLVVATPRAQAQNFNSFDEATIVSGATYTVNGSGSSQTITFGFSSPNTPIVLHFNNSSVFCPSAPGNSCNVNIGGVESLGLISNNGGAASTSSSTAAITNYNGTSAGTWAAGNFPSNGGPDYSNGNFGHGPFLTQGSGASAATANLGFTITTPGTFFLAGHFRTSDGAITGHVRIADNGPAGGPPPTVIPEPATTALMLPSLLPLGLLLRRRRRQPVA